MARRLPNANLLKAAVFAGAAHCAAATGLLYLSRSCEDKRDFVDDNSTCEYSL